MRPSICGHCDKYGLTRSNNENNLVFPYCLQYNCIGMESGVDGEMGWGWVGGDWREVGRADPMFLVESRSLLAHKPHSLTRAEGAASAASLASLLAEAAAALVLSRPVAEPPTAPCSELSILCTSTKHLTTFNLYFCPLKLHLHQSFLLYPLPPPFMVKGVPATQKAPCGSRGSPLHRGWIRLGLHSLTAYSIIGAWTTQASTLLMFSLLQ